MTAGSIARMAGIWDVSVPIHPGMPSWPGDPPVAVEAASRVAAGDAYNVSALRLGSHTGTHVDPPSHFIDGAAAVDDLPLDVLIGEALVVEAGAGPVTMAGVEALGLAGATRVLLKGPSVCLSPGAAGWLVDHGVRLVGVEALSVEPEDSPGFPTHWTLLSAGVVVVEGLDLSAVPPGRYRLVCLPLRLRGGDGGPARAVLLEL